MLELFWLITGIALGGACAWLISKYKFKSESKSNDTALKVFEERIRDLAHELESAKTELKRERDKVITLSNRLSGSEAEYRHLESKLHEQKDEINKLQEKFVFEFKQLAQDILEEKSKKFTEQNKTNLEVLLKPLGEKLVNFEKSIIESNKDSIERNSALREQIRSLKDLNLQITKEAENLTRALKGDTRTQGAWGEFILESILEKSGLVKDREYTAQNAFIHDDGRRYQPDVVIKLPDNKNLVIDSKVSLVSYENYVNSNDEKEMSESIAAFQQSIRKHINELSSKNYQSLYGIESLDFVIMFIPIEPAFGFAIQNDRNLFNDAYDKNIVIVSPSTLIATLRTIANIWKNEYQNQNALEIAKQSGALYDKFVGFTNDLIEVGNKLNSSQESYEKAMRKLTSGPGNLIKKVENIKTLGANTSKSQDKNLIKRAKLDN